MELPPREIKAFQHKILTWYEVNKRDLPWRPPSLKLRKDGTRDPYRVLISEVMSQQTQLVRVITKYEAWIKRFPTVQDLANAPVSEALRFWSGLGYNRRALNLQRAAKVIVEIHKGVFPRTLDGLKGLPGIGTYTASAVACFAFNEQIPVIDTNIRKVITHEFNEGILPDEKTIEQIALRILPEGKAYEWNQALMDYSSLIMKEKKIPVPKQSHFFSSNRYYRGQTIKLLLEVKVISFAGLLDYYAEKNPIDQSRLEDILRSMEKDGLLMYHEGSLLLPK